MVNYGKKNRGKSNISDQEIIKALLNRGSTAIPSRLFKPLEDELKGMCDELEIYKIDNNHYTFTCNDIDSLSYYELCVLVYD